jgi:ABC-type lipoprotein release transport system permease subunit
MALNNGIRLKLKEGINQAVSGQLTVYSAKSTKINIMESQLTEQQPFRWSSKDAKELQEIVPDLMINNRIRFGSLVSYGEETSFLNIHAIENEHILRIRKLISLQSGAMPKEGAEILIGETLAKDLHCSVGDTLLLVADNLNSYMSDALAVVTGIFKENGLASFFACSAFMPYNFGKEIVQLEDENSLEIIINSFGDNDIPYKRVKQISACLAGKSGNLNVTSWEATVPLFYTIANIWKSSGYLTQVIFVIFSLIILINLASLVMRSRKKEFGMLLAIGFSWKKITLTTCMEYLITGTLSVLAAYLVTSCINHSLPETGFYIPSTDLQQAFMTEFVKPFTNVRDLVYVLPLFDATLLLAVFISLFRIKKLNPLTLINNR